MISLLLIDTLPSDYLTNVQPVLILEFINFISFFFPIFVVSNGDFLLVPLLWISKFSIVTPASYNYISGDILNIHFLSLHPVSSPLIPTKFLHYTDSPKK